MGEVRVCGMRGCPKAHHARGYCKTHYARWLRHGDPAVTLRRDVYERARAELAEMDAMEHASARSAHMACWAEEDDA